MKKYILVIIILLVLCGCGGKTRKEALENSLNSEKTNEIEIDVENIDIKGMRDYYTKLKGDNNEEITLMFYMIGSDLESEYSSATNDLYEILDGSTDNINITLQTGGTLQWHNNAMTSNITQRHIVYDNYINTVSDLGKVSMVQPQTLTDFVNWSANEFPANRYILILWNHGGGTVKGFGVDEIYPNKQLSLGEIGYALSKTNVKFDFIGFDACLMGTIENAYILQNYADYLIASEESESTTGWYYKNWLSELSFNSSIDTVELSKYIIDDYIEGPDSTTSDTNTLSIVDLREMPNVYEKMCNVMKNSITYLDEKDGYQTIANARYKAKSFGNDKYEQIDIISYLNNLKDTEDVIELKKAIKSAVKYTNNSIPEATGLAMYFPYKNPEKYASVLENIKKYGLVNNNEEEFFNKLLSIMAKGKTQANNVNSQQVNDNINYNQYNWYNESNSQNIQVLNEDNLIFTKKNDKYVIKLSEKDWENITDININVLYNNGKGYTYLGKDSTYDVDEDNDLVLDFDYEWISLNGIVVPFYIEYNNSDDDDWYTYGYVPAVLNNNENILIYIMWNDENDFGYVRGYDLADDNNLTPYKGYHSFKKGDVIDFYFNQYNYDGIKIEDIYIDRINCNGELDDISVDYNIVNENFFIYYEITDIYNNVYKTEGIRLNKE